MRGLVLAFSFLTFFAVFQPDRSQAATLQNISGQVSVSTGNGFRPVAGATGVQPGDRVMAASNGSAQILYENGCTQTVGPGQTAVVIGNPACEASASGTNGTTTGLGTGTVVLGVVGVAAVAGAIIAIASDSDSDPPASP